MNEIQAAKTIVNNSVEKLSNETIDLINEGSRFHMKNHTGFAETCSKREYERKITENFKIANAGYYKKCQDTRQRLLQKLKSKQKE